MSEIRKITSHYVLTPQGLLKGAILSFNSDGQLLDIAVPQSVDATAGVEFFSGLLVPSFVNAHCHTELSYLHNKIERGGGFASFASSIASLRGETHINERIDSANYRINKMYRDGIGAVGDICNGSTTFEIKTKFPIHFHNFVEYFGLQTGDFSPMRTVEAAAEHHGLEFSPTPHSVYSLSDKPFREVAKRSNSLSIHFMESNAETELFKSKGPLHQRNIGLGVKIDFAHYHSPANRIVNSIDATKDILLVHNTFATAQDVETIESYFNGDVTWVLCPRSNMYIEGQLPPVEMLRNKSVRIAIGTDSLASNDSLSIIDELKMFQNIPLEEMLSWATINGAKALGIEHKMGSFEVGKSPGAVIISSIDWDNISLTEHSQSRRII